MGVVSSIQINEPAPSEIAPEDQEEVVEEQLAEDQPEEQGQEEQPERPEWLLDKYKSVEEQAKAYVELQKKLGERKPDNESPPANNVGEVLESARTEFFEQNGLSDTTYGTLEKSGFPREVVDAFIAGQNAMREQFDNKVRSVAGNQHDAMLDWADSNLTENQIAAYNNAYNSGDPDAAMMAAEYIFNRYKAENNKGVKVYQGETSGLGGVQPYGSMKEAAKDMGRPEYRDQNSSFHKQVQRRLQVSTF
jgi:hypothetical protein